MGGHVTLVVEIAEGHIATCSCGWEWDGPARERHDDAFMDAAVHRDEAALEPEDD